MATDIKDFYKGQTILLTGATGFLGKAITEKLLRTCPDIKQLYILVRSKKGKSVSQRTQELFNDSVFTRLKNENPDSLNKVVPITGDVGLPNLGISDETRKTLMETLNIIFHGAATVRFDEKLKMAVNINIFGTKQVLTLAKECGNLKAMLHISTAFANCNIKDIKEILYPPPVAGDELINVTECLPAELLDNCTPHIISGWPNTYAFTKQIAEDLIRKEASQSRLPVAILRPSIVTGAAEEPTPGWVDNIYGPNGVIAAVGAGLMHTMYADKTMKADLVPVDYVVNAALATVWDLACNRNSKAGEHDVPVLNYVSSERNQLRWSDFMEMTLRHGLKTPTTKSIWYYSMTITHHKLLFYLYTFLMHFLPALLVDVALLATAQKPQAVKIFKKMHKFMGVLTFFSSQEWNFHDDNMKSLWTKMSQDDRELFNFDISVLNWDEYFYHNIMGVRLYILKDTPDTVPAARRKMILLYILHRFVQLLFISLMVWLLWTPVVILFNWLATSGAAVLNFPSDAASTRPGLVNVVKSSTRHISVK